MMLFRSAQAKDLEAIFQLANQDTFELATLPKDKQQLEKQLLWACDSFNKLIEKPSHEYYLFVLEEPVSKSIVGTSAIEVAVGQKQPYYTYQITKKQRASPTLGIHCEDELLNFVIDKQEYSELCTLYLKPIYRQHGNGSLLSRGRFLFMAAYPQRFSHTVIAEIRGAVDASGHSPFWEHVSQHFFPMSFKEAEALNSSINKQFIPELMPAIPLYIKLLPKTAQEVIGKAHAAALPAMNILLHEEFYYHDHVHIFDAGPMIKATLHDITPIKRSQLITIEKIDAILGNQPFLIANTKLDFRATLGQAFINQAEKTCRINGKTAELLEVMPGDELRLFQ